MSMHVVFSEKKKVFPPRQTDSGFWWETEKCKHVKYPAVGNITCVGRSPSRSVWWIPYLLVCLKRARFSSMQVSQGWFHLITPRGPVSPESLLRKRKHQVKPLHWPPPVKIYDIIIYIYDDYIYIHVCMPMNELLLIKLHCCDQWHYTPPTCKHGQLPREVSLGLLAPLCRCPARENIHQQISRWFALYVSTVLICSTYIYQHVLFVCLI